MDEKIFNLLEQMQANIMDKFDKVDTRFDEMGKRLTKIEATLETDIKPNIKLALQGFVDTNEKLTSIDQKIDNLSDKVDRHDIKIQVIEGGKRA